MFDERESYYRIDRLFADYCAALDEGDLEVWPTFFEPDATYKLISRENYSHGFPVALLYCENQAMMVDRVYSLRNANIYQAHRYRHAISGIRIVETAEDYLRVASSYLVVQTLNDGETKIYQAGSYYDVLVAAGQQFKFKERLAVYDTSRVQTLLATPI